MILTKDLDTARWIHAQSEVKLSDTKKEYEKALNHLKFMKNLVNIGFVNLKTYQSYKQTTAKFRQCLEDQIKQCKTKRHESWRTYDTLQKAYKKQNPEKTFLEDTLDRLNEKQKQVLRDHFSKTNI